jgi:hypothetical protein
MRPKRQRHKPKEIMDAVKHADDKRAENAVADVKDL